MQKWEYRREEVRKGSKSLEARRRWGVVPRVVVEIQQRKANLYFGVGDDGPDFEDLDTFLERLGNEGWELCGQYHYEMAHGGQGFWWTPVRGFHLIFKRPKSGS